MGRVLARIAAVAAGVAVLAGLTWGVAAVAVRMQDSAGAALDVAPISVPESTTAPEPAPTEPAPTETAPPPAPTETSAPAPVQPAPVQPAPVQPAPPAPPGDDDDDDDGGGDDDDFGDD